MLDAARHSDLDALDTTGRGPARRRCTLLAPVPRPPKFLAIGLNYAAHVAESGMKPPEHQLWFNKQSTCVVGPGEPIQIPKASSMVDYEGELAFVIGRRCRHVPRGRRAERHRRLHDRQRRQRARLAVAHARP